MWAALSHTLPSGVFHRAHSGDTRSPPRSTHPVLAFHAEGPESRGHLRTSQQPQSPPQAGEQLPSALPGACWSEPGTAMADSAPRASFLGAVLGPRPSNQHQEFSRWFLCLLGTCARGKSQSFFSTQAPLFELSLEGQFVEGGPSLPPQDLTGQCSLNGAWSPVADLEQLSSLCMRRIRNSKAQASADMSM